MNFVLGPISMNVVIRLGLEASALQCSSLDCNPLEYFMWSEFEREVSKHTHNSLSSLNAKILVVMAKIDREVVIPACKRV
jgi:hypothetical protein